MTRKDISTLCVLRTAELTYAEKGISTWEYIQAETGAPGKVIEAAMEREDDRGYLEWGISIRTAWLTDSGKAKLKELRAGL